eukprot:876188_1
MMNFQLSIDVRDLEQISPRPKYLNQIEYLNITNKHTNRKSFNFKDAPNNCTFVMDVFDHVSSLLDAVHSPICNNNTFNFTTNNNTNSILKEGCLKPSKIPSNKNTRCSYNELRIDCKTNINNRVLSIHELANTF